MLVLSEDDVASLLDVPAAIEAVDGAFRDLGTAGSVTEPRRRLYLGATRLNLMSGALATVGRVAVKAYTRGPSSAVLLFDDAGELLAIIQSRFLSLCRTGAATGVATRWLAREDARRVGMIGVGHQAVAQLQAVAAVRPIDTVRVWGPTPTKAAAFAARMQAELDLEVVVAESAERAVAGADVVVTATSAAEPVLDGGWLAPGVHVNAIGANQAHRRELAVSVFDRAELVVVDDLAQARLEAGSLGAAVDAGSLRWEDVRALADLVPDDRGHDPGCGRRDRVHLARRRGRGRRGRGAGPRACGRRWGRPDALTQVPTGGRPPRACRGRNTMHHVRCGC